MGLQKSQADCMPEIIIHEQVSLEIIPLSDFPNKTQKIRFYDLDIARVCYYHNTAGVTPPQASQGGTK